MDEEHDVLSGIEREGPYKGQLVCPVINLFNAPGSARRVATVPHNTPVEIKNKKEYDNGRTYYEVVTLDYKTKRGWVLDSLLQKRGNKTVVE